MNNPGISDEIWTPLRSKWDELTAEGHTLKVEFNFLKDPQDESKVLAIDVMQNVDGEWFVQTVQRQAREACRVLGIDGVTMDELVDHAASMLISHNVTRYSGASSSKQDELHLFMKRLSPLTSEIYGHVIASDGERVAARTNYQHYYVLNEVLEQVSKIMKEEYSEIQLHRKKDEYGKIYFRFVHA